MFIDPGRSPVAHLRSPSPWPVWGFSLCSLCTLFCWGYCLCASFSLPFQCPSSSCACLSVPPLSFLFFYSCFLSILLDAPPNKKQNWVCFRGAGIVPVLASKEWGGDQHACENQFEIQSWESVHLGSSTQQEEDNQMGIVHRAGEQPIQTPMAASPSGAHPQALHTRYPTEKHPPHSPKPIVCLTVKLPAHRLA